MTEKSFAWDTTSVPAGLYRVRVTASDRPSNNPDDALSREQGQRDLHRRPRAARRDDQGPLATRRWRRSRTS